MRLKNSVGRSIDMLDDLNFYDEDFIEPEIADLIEFFDNEERQTTNTLTKKRVDEHFQEAGDLPGGRPHLLYADYLPQARLTV